MTNNKIRILTAAKHSGKTTKLVEWSTHRNDVFGILTPVVNGDRVFMNAHTKEQFPMEANENETNVLEVGKYRFSKPSFDRASAILLDALQQENGFIIVDEIGPLELRGLGFSRTVNTLLNDAKTKMEIVLVVREALVKDVVSYFNLKRFIIGPMAF